MPHLDTIKLGFGNSLILGSSGHIPLEKVSEKNVAEHREVESFGLFDTNQANYNTYYPEVTAEDLAPKDSEFIHPLFRALSEVVVHKDWNPVDFGVGSTLKKSMSLLRGQTVNADHETAIGNALGAVEEVSWENSYKTEGGIIVPAGINSRLKLDGKSHPRIARAIMMDPPAIHSTSVTVQFLWESSHPNLSQEEFFNKLGTFDADGKLIRRIATQIKRYHEISLVSHGADPYAQKIGKDGINNPVWANISYNKEGDGENKFQNKYFFFDFKSDLIQNNENISIPENSNNNKNESNMTLEQLLAALALSLGLADNAPKDATAIQAAITQLVTDKATLTEAAKNITPAEEITRLQGVETTYNELLKNQGKVAELTQFQDDVLTQLRAETLAAYNLTNKGVPLEPITQMISKADRTTLMGLKAQYTQQMEAAFPLTCKSCGGHEVSRATAEAAEGGAGEHTHVTKSNTDVVKNILDNNFKGAANTMHDIHENTK